MSENKDSENDSLADDILGNTEYQPTEPPTREFKPWHKPRKQYVRHWQWNSMIKKLLEESNSEDSCLRYLGLPGEDLLDLRYFHKEICEPKKMMLKFLGFNRGLKSEANESSFTNISLDEVKRLEFIDSASELIPDDICQLANTKSIAWQRSMIMGPFDVINIDLCDGFGKHPINEFRFTHYDTLNQIFTLQARKKNPWLLLLTTRSGSKHIDDGVLKILKGVFNSNLEECEKFNELSTKHYSIGNNTDLDSQISIGKTLSEIFLISLCKWISSLGSKQHPPSKIELMDAMGYVVDDEPQHLDLVSLAIRITPTYIAQPDLAGLTNQAIEDGIDECSLAVKCVKKINSMLDVDALLAKEEEVLNEMVSMSTELLEQARYETSGYLEWARQQ